MRSVLPRREAHSCKPKDPHPPHLPGAVCLCSPDMCCPWTRKPSDAHLDESQQKGEISVEKLQSKMRIWTSWLDHYCPLLGDGERRDDSNGLGFFFRIETICSWVLSPLNMLDTASQPREIKHCTRSSMSLIAGGAREGAGWWMEAWTSNMCNEQELWKKHNNDF